MNFGEGKGTPLQYSCLENPMDGGAWWAAIHGVVKSRTRLSDFTFTFHFHALEKEMATHSSVLAWRIPGTEEPVYGLCHLWGRTESDTTDVTQQQQQQQYEFMTVKEKRYERKKVSVETCACICVYCCMFTYTHTLMYVLPVTT